MERVSIVLHRIYPRDFPYKILLTAETLKSLPLEAVTLISLILSKQIRKETVPLTATEQERMSRAIACLSSYNMVRRRFYEKKGGFIPQAFIFTRNIRKHCLSIVDFCDRYKVTDFTLFFMTLFEAGNWSWCRPLSACYSPNCFDLWSSKSQETRVKMVQEREIKDQLDQDKQSMEKGTKRSPYRDLYDWVERKKAYYQKNKEEDLCLASIDETLGFHPKSETCKVCKLAHVCRMQIQKKVSLLSKGLVDVVAIREGREELKDVARIIRNHKVPIDLYSERIG